MLITRRHDRPRRYRIKTARCISPMFYKAGRRDSRRIAASRAGSGTFQPRALGMAGRSSLIYRGVCTYIPTYSTCLHDTYPYLPTYLPTYILHTYIPNTVIHTLLIHRCVRRTQLHTYIHTAHSPRLGDTTDSTAQMQRPPSHAAIADRAQYTQIHCVAREQETSP